MKAKRQRRDSIKVVLTEGKALTEAQVRRMAELARTTMFTGERNRLMILTLFYCFGRINEVLRLVPDSLMLPDLLKLPTSKYRRKEVAKYRLVTIPGWLWHELREYARTVPKGQPLFPVTRARAWQILSGLGKQMGLEVWCHLFRHSATCDLIERGASLPVVQKAGGWSSLRTVEHYFRFYDEKRAMEQIRKLRRG